MTFLNDADPQPTTPLRAFMRDKIGDLGESWHKRGFNRGHRESHYQMRKGKVPRTLQYDDSRRFFRGSGSKRTVGLKSVL
jgi:hypothetical protein